MLGNGINGKVGESGGAGWHGLISASCGVLLVSNTAGMLLNSTGKSV